MRSKWINIHNTDPNIFLNNLVGHLNTLYYECFPLKTKFISIRKLCNPWCTAEIQKLVSLKSKIFNLYKMGLVSHSENNSFKNKVKKILDRSKDDYYRMEFFRAKNNLKKTWSLIKNLSASKN